MLSFLTGAYVAFGNGSAALLTARLSRQISPIVAAFWGGLFGMIILFAAALISLGKDLLPVILGTQDLYWFILGGLFLAVGNILFYTAVKKNSTGIISSLASAAPIVNILIAVLLSLVAINLLTAVGVFLVFCGVGILVWDHQRTLNTGKPILITTIGILSGCAVALFFGLTSSVIMYAVAGANWIIVMLVIKATSVLIIGLWLLFTQRDQFFPSFKAPWKIMVMLGFFEATVGLALSLGGRSGYPVIVISLSALAPTVAAILAYRFLGEKISPMQITSIIVSMLGVIILGISR